MDAEAYPEASKNVLHILWDIFTSTRLDSELERAKARISALKALGQYEVYLMNACIYIFSITLPSFAFCKLCVS